MPLAFSSLMRVLAHLIAVVLGDSLFRGSSCTVTQYILLFSFSKGTIQQEETVGGLTGR